MVSLSSRLTSRHFLSNLKIQSCDISFLLFDVLSSHSGNDVDIKNRIDPTTREVFVRCFLFVLACLDG